MFIQINGAGDTRTPVVTVVRVVPIKAPQDRHSGPSVSANARTDGPECPSCIVRSIERTAKHDADVIVAQSAGEERGVEQLVNLTEVREA